MVERKRINEESTGANEPNELEAIHADIPDPAQELQLHHGSQQLKTPGMLDAMTRSLPWCLSISVLVLISVFLYPLIYRNDGWWTAVTVIQSISLFFILLDIIFCGSNGSGGTIERIGDRVSRGIQLIVFGLGLITLPPVALAILRVPLNNSWETHITEANSIISRYIRLRFVLNDFSLVQLAYVPLLLAVRYRKTSAWSSQMATTIRQPLMVTLPFLICMLFAVTSQLRVFVVQPVTPDLLASLIDFLGVAGCQALTLAEVRDLFGFDKKGNGAALISATFGDKEFVLKRTSTHSFNAIKIFGLFPGTVDTEYALFYEYSEYEARTLVFHEARRLAAVFFIILACTATHYFVWRVLEVNLAELLQPLVEKANILGSETIAPRFSDAHGDPVYRRPPQANPSSGVVTLEDAVIKVTYLLDSFESLKSNTGAMRVLNTLLDQKEIDAPTLKFLMDNYMDNDQLDAGMPGRMSSRGARQSSMRMGGAAVRKSSVAGSSKESKKSSSTVLPPAGSAGSLGQSTTPGTAKPRALPATFEHLKLFDHISPAELQKLNSWEWDPWYYTREQLVAAVMHLFINLDLLDGDITDADKLWSFLDELSKAYMEVPYHNWKHAADVAHTVYLLLRTTANRTQITPMEKFSLMVAAVSHDVGHPGTNNTFLVNTRDPLAITYNDSSVLENRHLAILYSIVTTKPECNIFSELTPEAWKECRKLIIDCILHTDMSNHFRMVSGLQQFADMCQRQRRHIQEFGGVTKDSVFESKEERMLMLHTLLHTADISNMLKPNPMAIQWGLRVLEEFFSQGDKERSMGMPVSPMMDRATTSIGLTQMNFIEFIVEPLLAQVVRLFPELTYMYGHLRQNYESYYTQTINDITSGMATITQEALDEKLRAFRGKIQANERGMLVRPKRGSHDMRASQLAKAMATLDDSQYGRKSRTGLDSNGGSTVGSTIGTGAYLRHQNNSNIVPQRSTGSALLKEGPARRGFRRSIEAVRMTASQMFSGSGGSLVKPNGPTSSVAMSKPSPAITTSYVRASDTNMFGKAPSGTGIKDGPRPVVSLPGAEPSSVNKNPAKFLPLPQHLEDRLTGANASTRDARSPSDKARNSGVNLEGSGPPSAMTGGTVVPTAASEDFQGFPRMPMIQALKAGDSVAGPASAPHAGGKWKVMGPGLARVQSKGGPAISDSVALEESNGGNGSKTGSKRENFGPPI